MRDSAEDFLSEPSDEVWLRINNELHPQTRRYALWWAAGILLLISSGIYMVQRRHTASTGQAFSEKLHEPKLPGNAPDHSANGLLQNESRSSAEKKNITTAKRKGSAAGRFSPSSAPASQQETDRSISMEERNNSFQKRYTLPLLRNSLSGHTDMPKLVFPEAGISLPVRMSDLKVEQPASVWQQDLIQEKGPAAEVARKQWRKKPVLGFSFTPGIGYRVLKIAPPEPVYASPAPPRSGSNSLSSAQASGSRVRFKQEPDWSWVAAAQVTIPLGKQWFMQSGLSVTRISYRILAYGTYPAYVQNNGDPSIASRRNINSFYTTNAVVPVTKPSYIHNRYLAAEVPLLIGWQLGNPDKTSFSIGAGAGLSYLLGSNTVIYSPDSRRYFTDKDYPRTINGNLHLETSVHLPLTEKFRISVGPSFQYQAFSTYKNYPQVKEHPYFLGIKTGLQWTKNK